MRTSAFAIIVLTLVFFCTNFSYSQNDLPVHKQGMFTASGNCKMCHNGNSGANTYRGEDVSQPSTWRATMMSNSSADPFWRAKVDAELMSVKSKVIQKAASDLCLKCHSPMGYTQSVADGKSAEYTTEKSYSDLLATDGVSCALCHQIQPDNLGLQESYKGNYKIGKERMIFGPYKDVKTPKGLHEEFKPVFGEHLNRSEFCAVCHTVITPRVTENEEISGEFLEQTPYIEWKNSGYPESGINCQSCHMPAIESPIDIASVPADDTTKRTPFYRHQFVGGNASLQKIFTKNADELKLKSSPSFHDSKLKETIANLQDNALSLSGEAKLNGENLEIKVKLENQAGHKLPTGIPFRRMWVHLTVKDSKGGIVFESGAYDAEGKIIGTDENHYLHYPEITKPEQVQIYEGVMADASGKRTFSLLKADRYVKDNRIPPSGFTSVHPSYDTCRIIGNANEDPDFNKDAKGNEGAGSDIVTYKISGIKETGFDIKVEVLYQSFTPEMVEYLGKTDSPSIVSFISMYKKSEIQPVLLKSITLKTN